MQITVDQLQTLAGQLALENRLKDATITALQAEIENLKQQLEDKDSKEE